MYHKQNNTWSVKAIGLYIELPLTQQVSQRTAQYSLSFEKIFDILQRKETN